MRGRLFLTVTAILLLAGCHHKQAGNVKIDPGLAMLVPADTSLVAGARIDQIRATAVYRKLVELWNPRWLSDLSSPLGPDFRQDLWDVLLTSNGRETALLARGKFTPEGGLEPRLEEFAGHLSSYRGYRIAGTDNMAIVFVNPSTAVIGPAKRLRTILDQKDNGQTGIPAPLVALLKTVPPQSQVWAVSDPVSLVFPAQKLPQAGHFAGLAQYLHLIQNFAVGVDLRLGIEASGQATCPSVDSATLLRNGLRGLIGLGRLRTPDDQPEALRFLDDIQVEQEQKNVRLHARIPLDVVEKAAAFAAHRSGR